MVTFVNEGFVEADKAVLGIGDLTIQRGYGIFEFFRTRNNVPLFIDDYLVRFYRSAATLRLHPEYNINEMKHLIQELIRRNDVPEAGFKMILTGGYSIDGFVPSSSNFIISQQPIQLPTEEKFNNGVKIILHEYLRDVPEAKSINYLMAIYLREKLQQQNADDVLYYNNGSVLELPRSNVFIVTNDHTVVTPLENVLHGITRMKVLDLAAQNYKVEERAISVGELKNAAEVFLTSTTKRILPVVEIDGIIVGNGKPGEVTKSLYHSFLDLEAKFIAGKDVSV